MGLIEKVITVWQKAPLSWRRQIVCSPLAPVLRSIANLSYSSEPQIFELAEPLRSHRMRLHWQTQKAYVFGTYEPEVARTIQEVVRPGSLAIDVGAHIGYYTLLLAKQVAPLGRVIAFEPLPQNYEILSENVRLNFYRNVVVEKRAVIDRSGRVMLKRSNEGPLTRITSVSTEMGEQVEAVSLDDYFERTRQPERVAFVKIDVEGAELAVLNGMTRILEKDRPLLLLELHGFNVYRDRHPVVLELTRRAYSVHYLDGPGSEVHMLGNPAT